VNFVALENRETGLIGNRIAVDDDKITSKVIQSASKVVESITCDSTNVFRHGVNLAHKEEIKILISRIRMWPGSDGVWFALDEPVPQGFQIHEVVLGPFDLNADKRESFIDSHQGIIIGMLLACKQITPNAPEQTPGLPLNDQDGVLNATPGGEGPALWVFLNLLASDVFDCLIVDRLAGSERGVQRRAGDVNSSALLLLLAIHSTAL
jgi:hypothetical protein